MRAPVDELLAAVVKVRRDPRLGGELAGAELLSARAVDAAVPAAEIAVREHAPREPGDEIEQARARPFPRQPRFAKPNCLSEFQEIFGSGLQSAP